jgi:hypothetical protein
MDAQELRNLQEAYMEVVENQQLNEEEQSSMPPRRSAAERKKRAKELGDRQTIRGIVSGYNKKRQPSRQEDPEKYYPKEQYDLYDIILSHLLDEGYAETPEAAEVIMVNMSEEWRDDIIDEELTGERLSRAARKDGRDALAKKDRTILHRVMGHSNQDQTSFGKGNKATRRQGYTVPDTSNRHYQDEWRSSHNKNRGVKNKKSGNYN